MDMRFVSIEEKIFEWAVKTPDKIALINKKESFSYKELFENIWSTKTWFEKEFTLEKGHS